MVHSYTRFPQYPLTALDLVASPEKVNTLASSRLPHRLPGTRFAQRCIPKSKNNAFKRYTLFSQISAD